MNDGSKQKLWAKNIIIATGSDIMSIPGVTVHISPCTMPMLVFLELA